MQQAAVLRRPSLVAASGRHAKLIYSPNLPLGRFCACRHVPCVPRALSQSQGLEAPQTTLLVPEVVSAPQSAPALKGLGSPEINTESKGGWWDGLFRSAVKAAGVLGLAVVVALASPSAALAKGSGGRAGGRSFSSARSSSSYGSSKSSSSSSHSGYSGSSSFGYSSGPAVTQRSSTIIVSPSYGIPFGGYGGYSGYSAGVEVVPRPAVAVYDSGAYDVFDVLLLLMLAVMVVGAASGLFDSGRSWLSDAKSSSSSSTTASRMSVVSLQVGVLAVGNPQASITAIADGAETKSALGLQALLQDMCLYLLRQPEYCAYGGLSVQRSLSARAAESAIDAASLEQRAKFGEETRVNFGGRKRKASRAGTPAYAGSGLRGAASAPKEVVVVTLLVAAEESEEVAALAALGRMGRVADLRKALKALAAIPPTDIRAVEVLWTPEEEGDSMSLDELVADYPTLVPLA